MDLLFWLSIIVIKVVYHFFNAHGIFRRLLSAVNESAHVCCKKQHTSIEKVDSGYAMHRENISEYHRILRVSIVVVQIQQRGEQNIPYHQRLACLSLI